MAALLSMPGIRSFMMSVRGKLILHNVFLIRNDNIRDEVLRTGNQLGSLLFLNPFPVSYGSLFLFFKKSGTAGLLEIQTIQSPWYDRKAEK